MLLENTLDSVNFSVHFKNVNNFKKKSTKVLKTAANDVLLTDLITKLLKVRISKLFQNFFFSSSSLKRLFNEVRFFRYYS